MNARVRLLHHGPTSASDPTEHRRFGGALSASAGIHVFLIGLLLFATYVVFPKKEETPVVFELVAGEGEDFSATEAPAGDEGGRAATGEIAMPRLTPVPVWTPPAPVAPPTPPPPTPVAPVPPTPVTPVSSVPTPPTPNFARQLKATIRQEQRKVECELKQKREAEAREAKAAEQAAKRVSYEEFAKANAGKSNPSQRTTTTATSAKTGPRLDPDAIKRGVAGATGAGAAGAGGKELTAAERERMKAYFAMLIQRLRDAHVKPDGLSDLLSADVSFTVTAGGAVAGARITRSSGNADFDRSVLDAFSRVRMPARPDGKTDAQELTFRIREA